MTSWLGLWPCGLNTNLEFVSVYFLIWAQSKAPLTAQNKCFCHNPSLTQTSSSFFHFRYGAQGKPFFYSGKSFCSATESDNAPVSCQSYFEITNPNSVILHVVSFSVWTCDYQHVALTCRKRAHKHIHAKRLYILDICVLFSAVSYDD